MNMEMMLSLPLTVFVIVTVSSMDVRSTPASYEPLFDSSSANVTVKEGQVAVLPCGIKYRGEHQVVWTDELYTVLTKEDRRIIDDDRISVERPFLSMWNLHIRDVTYNDRGQYHCQVNTNPVKIKTVTLKVRVPAKILLNGSTESVTVREGHTAHLECRTTGIPQPKVTWRRQRKDKGDEISEFCKETDTVGNTGDVLVIHNISRECGDIYECVANNSKEDHVSKQIPVHVHFPPEVYMGNIKIYQDIGKETILDCTITANPQALGKWMKDGKEIKTTPSRYRIVPYTESRYSLSLTLRIIMIQKEDFGRYTCIGSNELGEDRGMMVLYDYSEHKRLQLATTTSTTTTTLQPPYNPYQHRQHHRHRAHGYSSRDDSDDSPYTHQGSNYNSKRPMDGRLRYEPGRPGAGDVEGGAGYSRGADGNIASSLGQNFGQVSLKIVPLWLTLIISNCVYG